MKHLIYNNMLDISCIPYCYQCSICNERILEKSCKAIRFNEKNYYIHNGHIAVDNAAWIHKINNQVNYGKTA